jgi:hypothetical protein
MMVLRCSLYSSVEYLTREVTETICNDDRVYKYNCKCKISNHIVNDTKILQGENAMTQFWQNNTAKDASILDDFACVLTTSPSKKICPSPFMTFRVLLCFTLDGTCKTRLDIWKSCYLPLLLRRHHQC